MLISLQRPSQKPDHAMANDTKPLQPVATATAKNYIHGPNLAKKRVLENGDLPTFKGQAGSVIRGVEGYQPVCSTKLHSRDSRPDPSSGHTSAGTTTLNDSEVTKRRSNRTSLQDGKTAPQPAQVPQSQLPSQHDESFYEFERPRERSCCIIL